jgi:addiction module HigA family antidote
MIESFDNPRTGALLKGYRVHGMTPDQQREAMVRLMMLDAAETLDDLATAPLARPVRLAGGAPGSWAVPIGGTWRLRFIWPDGGSCNAGEGFSRDALDRELIDMKKATTGDRLEPVHPGMILKEQFLDPNDISVYALANAIKVPRSRANDIVLGRRAITADTALRLGHYFGTSAEFWIRLQAHHDVDVARREDGKTVAREVQPYKA